MVQQLTSPATTDAPLHMTYEEYLDWAVDHPHSEWVDGEVIEFMSVKERHALVVGFLFELIRSFVRIRQLGRVYGDPFAMKIRAGGATRQPDVFVLLATHLDRLRDGRLEGPADLVVEVVSDDSVTRDYQHKLVDYAEARIPEYWIVEGRADLSGVELHVRNAAGDYERVLPDAEGRLHSSVLPGFWLDPAWLAADLLPDVDDILDEIVPGIHEERARRARARRAARGDQCS